MMLMSDSFLLIYALIVIIAGITFIVSSFSNTYSQSLHEKTLYMNRYLSSEVEDKSQINVGNKPSTIAVDKNVYVANSGSNTISVISVENNTKIKDIQVGQKPT